MAMHCNYIVILYFKVRLIKRNIFVCIAKQIELRFIWDYKIGCWIPAALARAFMNSLGKLQCNNHIQMASIGSNKQTLMFSSGVFLFQCEQHPSVPTQQKMGLVRQAFASNVLNWHEKAPIFHGCTRRATSIHL